MEKTIQKYFEINRLEETKKLGLILGEIVTPGDVICLEGDLGAGKTTLTQSIALGMGVGVDQYVTSPSFAILHEYFGRIPLYHMDFYRLGGEDEVIDLGFEDYFYGEGLTVIEWPSRAYDVIPEDALSLTMNVDDEKRLITLACRETSSWMEKISTLLKRYTGE